jgi:hypothetical protein
MPLLLQNPQQSADGGIARGIGEGGAHFAGGRGLPGVQDVHDLPLAAAQLMFQTHNVLNY